MDSSSSSLIFFKAFSFPFLEKGRDFLVEGKSSLAVSLVLESPSKSDPSSALGVSGL